MNNNLTIDEVAKRYRLSGDRFRKKLGALYAIGFPRPLPGFGKCLWSPRHLDAWEDGAQPEALRRPQDADGTASWDAELVARLVETKAA